MSTVFRKKKQKTKKHFASFNTQPQIQHTHIVEWVNQPQVGLINCSEDLKITTSYTMWYCCNFHWMVSLHSTSEILYIKDLHISMTASISKSFQSPGLSYLQTSCLTDNMSSYIKVFLVRATYPDSFGEMCTDME